MVNNQPPPIRIPPRNWVWNGKPCSIQEFAKKAYGDTQQRTDFLLKYSKGE